MLSKQASQALADAAVISVPGDQWGEAVKAVGQLREGASATEDEIIEHCRGQMGGFERPRSVDFVSSLPRNASGKVLKRELRELYWEDRGPTGRIPPPGLLFVHNGKWAYTTANRTPAG